MQRTHFAISGLVLLLGLVPSAARAQSGGPYDLSWSTIDGGGATPLAGGDFTLGGTTGQPDAGAVHGGPFAVLGGFWGSESFAVGVEDDPPAEALAFRLRAGVPNPFNPSTRLDFDLPSPASVRLAVYDLRGARVRVLEDGSLPAGRYSRSWDGRDDAGAPAASGVYFFQLEAGEQSARQKGILLK
jgi:hypothetical protein